VFLRVEVGMIVHIGYHQVHVVIYKKIKHQAQLVSVALNRILDRQKDQGLWMVTSSQQENKVVKRRNKLK
jgi:hypothetical protein